MTSSPGDRDAASICVEALERPVGDRTRYLDQACGRDGVLRMEVERLLARAGEFLEVPPWATPHTPLMPGVRLGPYEIEATLGAGGMGEVFKARDTRLGRFVALKILPPDLRADPQRRRRFGREARAAAALSHPHICAVYDVGTDSGVDYLVMELVEGETLEARLDPGQERTAAEGLPVGEAVRYAIEIADALDTAHRLGIVHRDIKPSNIMLTPAGTKLLDFGLAKLTRAQETATVGGGSTGDRAIVGTIAYMAPEQLLGREADARSDIFSLGAVVYEMVSGRSPFRHDSMAASMAALLRDAPPPLPVRVPASVGAVIRQCLEKDPQVRYQTAIELKQALEVAREEQLQGPVTRTSVAVLPFRPLGADPDFFAEGLAEEVINALAPNPGLLVIAPTSAFAAWNTATDPGGAAARLGAEHVLYGSLRRASGRIRLTVHLARVKDGRQVWGDTYDRDASDVFALHDEIARRIAEALSVRLPGLPPGDRRPTGNLDAYTLNLEGRHHLAKGTPEALSRAKACFENAIRLDARFVGAYDGLAELYYLLGFFGLLPPREAFELALWNVLRVVELDDALGEPHALLGMLRKELDYNWPEVRREFARARELSPQSPVVRLRNAVCGLMPFGRLSEAVAELEAVLEFDPLSPWVRFWLGMMRFLARDYRGAEREADHVLDLDAGQPMGHFVRGISLELLGDVSGAIQAFERAAFFSGRMPLMVGYLAAALAVAGRIDEARTLRGQLVDLSRTQYVPPSAIGRVSLCLGELDVAFEWFQHAVDRRDPMIIPLRTTPHADPIRLDPRFEVLLRKMNLDDASVRASGGCPC